MTELEIKEENKKNWFAGSLAPDWFIDYMTDNNHLVNFIHDCINYVCENPYEFVGTYETSVGIVLDDAKHVGQRYAQAVLNEVIDEESAVEFMQWYVDEDFTR